MKKSLGLIVNPIAGIGGRVGLKGSDGAEIQQRALALGAVPQAQQRTLQALEKLKGADELEILTYPGDMGELVARSCGFAPVVIGSITPGHTTAQDTVSAAREMLGQGMDLLLFAGGDGTARDVYQAVGLGPPALGIPAGVKIHSAVYATSPPSAGTLAGLWLRGRLTSLREAEVMDIDEDAVRQGSVSARLYGYLRVPSHSGMMQSLKVPSHGEGAALAEVAVSIAETMEPGWLYILGPGTTMRAIADELGLPKTLIGVDVVEKCGKSGVQEQQAVGNASRARLVAADANESQLLALIQERRARIVVTPIGGQGYLFGRGNQQISAQVIRQVGKENLIIVSTPDKLHGLGSLPLRVDTGDPTVDQMLSGYVRVTTGYREQAVRKVTG